MSYECMVGFAHSANYMYLGDEQGDAGGEYALGFRSERLLAICLIIIYHRK